MNHIHAIDNMLENLALLKIGKKQTLKIDHIDGSGYYLLCDQEEEVFMPGSLASKEYELGDMVEIFIFTDKKGDQLATSKLPFAEVGDFACLEVMSVNQSGAFLDVGLPKDILVPGGLQKHQMREGQKHLVKVLIDDENRMYGTEKINPYLAGSDFFSLSQIVKIMPFHRTPLGYKVLIENKCLGMIYHNEIFQKILLGEEYEATIKAIRNDKQVDLILGRVGKSGSEMNTKKIMDFIERSNGKITLTDKSSPSEIKEALNMSKNAFKNAVGALYKQRLIVLKEDCIESTHNANSN